MTLNIFLSPVKYILQICLAKFSISATFLGGRDGTGQTGREDGTDIGTDRLFSENIILDFEMYLIRFHEMYTLVYADFVEFLNCAHLTSGNAHLL